MSSFIPKVRLQWANKVRHDPRFRPTEHSVAAEIANHANINGNAWPSKRRLAEKLGLSERTIQRAIAKLVKYGYLARIVRLGRSNLYQLRFPGVRHDVDNPTEDRPPGGETDSNRVSGASHASPPTEDTDGQKTFPEPNFKTFDASPPSRASEKPKLRNRPKGLEGKNGGRASQVYSNGQTRTELELELARRLGKGGTESLVSIPPFVVEFLLRRLADGQFGEFDVERVRDLAQPRRRHRKTKPAAVDGDPEDEGGG